MSSIDPRAIATDGYWVTTIGDRVVRLPAGLVTIYQRCGQWLKKATDGMVYPYRPRELFRPELFRQLCTVRAEKDDRTSDQTIINAWFFHRVQTPEDRTAVNTCDRTHTIKIYGYWDDGRANAEEYFNKIMIESVCAEFRKHEAVDQVNTGAYAAADPLTVNDADWYAFGDFLCLRGEFTWTVREEVVWSA